MNSNIKAIILDIDGVIIGEKIGVNSPYPNSKVIKALQKLKADGYLVVACTGKPFLAIEKIIKNATLYNLHIVDGGATLFDPVNKTPVKIKSIGGERAVPIIEFFLNNNIYTEFYTQNDYYVQRSQVGIKTEKHSFVLQRNPIVVNNLAKEAAKHNVIRLMLIADDKTKINLIQGLFDKNFKNKLNIRWSTHPPILPLQFGIVTAKGISKKEMLYDLLDSYSLSTDDILSIGDSMSDWEFMQISKYVATVENADPLLKNLVNSKGKDYSYIGKSVDENGILDIIKHFKLNNE